MPVSPQPWISVVVPIQDERDNLPPLTSQLLKFLEGRKESVHHPFEIIFVDDGSVDGSAPLLKQISRQHKEIQVVHFDRNYGQTAAFDAGFQVARGEWVVTLDGDLQYDPTDIGALLPLTGQYDVVCGVRRQRHDNLIRRWSSTLAKAVRNAVIHDDCTDTGCSLKMFHRPVLERIPRFHGMHRFFPALVKMYGFSVAEVPVKHFPRAHGQSKYGIRNRLFAGLYDLLAVQWMQRRKLNYTVKCKRDDSDQEERLHSHDR